MHAAPTQTDRCDQATPRYEASALTKGGPVAQIALDDKVYTLRITRTGKLILTK